MAAITSATSGNWSNPATWSGGVVPGAGDTVTLLNQVFVDVNTTIGAANGNYVSGGNPAAIMLSGTAGNVEIVINPGITLTCRGDFATSKTGGSANRGLAMYNGSTFRFDSSTSTNPTTTHYAFVPIGNGLPFGVRTVNTTAAQPATITSVAGGGNGYYNNNGSFGSGVMVCSFMNFINIGDATHDCWAPCFTDATWNVSLADFVFDGCGQLNFIEASQSASWPNNFTRVVFKNSLAGWNVRNNPSFATFDHCVFDKNVDTGNSTYIHNYFGNGFVSGGTALLWSFSDNMVISHTGNAGYNTNGSSDGSYWIADTSQNNVHHAILNHNFAPVWTNNTFEDTNNSGDGDAISQEGSADPVSGAELATLTGNLVLPNAAGESTANLISGGTPSNAAGRVWDVRNNTVFTGSQGLCQDDNNGTNSFSHLQNNIIWDKAGQSRGWILQDTASLNAQTTTGLTQDLVSPANTGKNCTINLQWTVSGTPGFVNQANGYQAWFSSTPGATDLRVDPAFLDNTRTVATFSVRYLGSVAGSTWASHATTDNFVVGQIVSNNNAIFYGGALINFRCIVAHAKSTTGSEPGGSFTSAWRTYWELESLYLLRTAIAAGTTYTDASLSLTNATPIQTLQAWVRRGFAPTNAALKAAGTDGTDIGAVAVQSTSHGHLLMMGI